MKSTLLLIGATVLIGVLSLAVSPSPAQTLAVIYPRDAGILEEFSAKEIQRYLYVRTGTVAELVRRDDMPAGYSSYIVVSRKGSRLLSSVGNAADILKSSRDLKSEEYFFRTYSTPGSKHHVIVGGDGPGVLYGSYKFVEATGVRYSLDGDIIPDGRYNLRTLNVSETSKPQFKKRGLQPFHDFNVGPDWWNLHDYNNVLSQMTKLRMNFIGFHTYPSWNPAAGPEANVWIGLPEDVDEQGNVWFGYEAGVVTTRRGWEVKPFPTSQYACGAGLLFEGDDYAPDFMQECLDWPRSDSAAALMFNRYGDFQKSVFETARRLGIQTCIGTELPLGIPPSLGGRLKSRGMNPDDPAVIRKLYEGTFLRLIRKMPVDYYWLWLPEIWLFAEPGCPGWEITTEQNVERELAIIDSAARHVNAPFGFATSGWRLGTLKDPLWLDKRAPKSWPVSSLTLHAGRDPVEKYYSEMPGRQKWVIGWAEDDDAARAHCCTTWDLQLWVDRMFRNSADALRFGCEGMLAIQWRTASIAPNIAALSQAGWRTGRQAGVNSNPDSSRIPGSDSFWEDWGRSTFGGNSGVEAGREMQKFDGGHLSINAMINDGCKTTDSTILRYFAPLAALESLRKRIEGSGNLERFDFWLNYIRATQHRVRTWVLAARLDSMVNRTTSMPGGESKTRFVREEVLPLRISVARSYESMITAFVDCARTPGEIGTIASIESGNRQRIVNAHDSTLTSLLGGTLPAEASIRTEYRGGPRIFVSSSCTQWKVGEPMEIRPFVLSASACTGVQVYWRFLGEGSFKKVAATHRARQAYRVTLPTKTEGTLEYYIEATLDNGKTVLSPVTAPSINHTVIVW